MTTIDKVRSEVMTLSASERASLAHELILSLDDPTEYDLSPVQETEIQRRLKMVREGRAFGRPVTEVFSDIKARYP
jgi:putative addiction module component (TIGR02574 family)